MDEKELLAIIEKAAKLKATSLNLSSYQLTTLPAEIGELTNLTKLELAGNELSSLPAEIGKLTKLTSLNLNATKLSSLPAEIGKLTNLTEINLDVNQLSSLPSEIGQLANLKELGLNGNQLSSLPSEIGQLKNLTGLDLSCNELSSLPSEIGQLTDLTKLNLSGNQLSSLPSEIGQLTNLMELWLVNNKLNLLPESLKNIRSLKYLFLHDNSQLGIPLELLGPEPKGYFVEPRGKVVEPARILDYYFRTRGGKRPLNEAKIILVGRGEAGKTCIVNRLVDNVFKKTSKTEGIKIRDWKVKTGKDEIRLNIWDFGGQEIMHATHQFFLTQRSLYLLVLNGREGGEDYDAEYWLKLIESFAGDSPVIVVLNKIEEHSFDLNRRGLQAKYPQICGFIETDCKDNVGFAELHKEIKRVLGEMKSIKVNFPSAWFAIKDKLAGMKKNYLSFEQFREVCRMNGEKDAKAQEELAGFLHCLGVALNYKDDLRLRDTSVLNPKWVTQGIYRLLNAGQLSKSKGVLKLSNMAEILPARTYPVEKHAFLMEMMRKFRLCFAFPDGQNRYLVPELLGKEEPDLKGEFEPRNCLNFEYNYSILPEGLLPQFIVRTHTLSHNQSRWRSGAVLQWEGCRALVKADAVATEPRVVIRICGGNADGRRRLLAVIRCDFERIHSDISKLEVTGKVPLPEYPEVTIDYDDLVGFEKDGVKEMPVRAAGKTVNVNIVDLLNGVDLPDVRRQPGPEERGQQQQPLSLFYSYSHKDETLRDELETHLKLLQRQGMISGWHDRRILAGEEWDKKIDDNLKNADIILLLISADFIASDYCYDVEIKYAMARHENKEAVVIPVILRKCDWHSVQFSKVKLGDIQALPKDGNAVTIWSDRDSAWHDVEQGIKKKIEELRKARSWGLNDETTPMR